MIAACGQQRLLAGKARAGGVLASALLLRDADAVVEGAAPGPRGDALHPYDPRRGHEFAAVIALGTNANPRRARVARLHPFARHPVAALGERFPISDLDIALEHLETRADFVDAV